MLKKSFIIRFADAAFQPKDLPVDSTVVVRRVVGTVQMRELLPLFAEGLLDPNPRSAKVNRVTDDISDSLQRDPDLFRNKSKGILLGTANYEPLQRNRYRVTFEDREVEGILDGGHNMLAIGLHILQDFMDQSELARVKSWDDLLSVWPEHQKSIERRKEDYTILVPVELLVPACDDGETVDAFRSALIDICAARNNNAQLPIEAAANKRGYYSEIKAHVNKKLADRTEWRPNTWEDEDEKRPVKVRELVALAWIPLNLLSEKNALPVDLHVSPQNIYRNKGECSKLFNQLMSNESVTEKGDGAVHKLIHEGVQSAFQVLGDLPELYDQIYEEFPDAYNENNKRFRANPIVKLYDPEGRRSARASGKDLRGFTATQPRTPFFRRPVKARGGSKPCSYPEGLIVPLVYGLQGLMDVVDGKVRWAVEDPSEFVRNALPEVAGAYQMVLEFAKWDPQKISKQKESHEFAVKQFRDALRAESFAL